MPVMLILWRMVLLADRLHAWKYNEQSDPPTQSDYTFAALVFFPSLLTPLFFGLIAAFVAYYKKYRACWSLLETGAVASIYLMFIAGAVFKNLFMKNEYVAVIGIVGASCLVGGVIVTVLINAGACVRQRSWGKLANSVLVFL
jgi:hypothetical protein